MAQLAHHTRRRMIYVDGQRVNAHTRTAYGTTAPPVIHHLAHVAAVLPYDAQSKNQ